MRMRPTALKAADMTWKRCSRAENGNGIGRMFLAITALTVSIAASIKEAVEGIAERGIDAPHARPYQYRSWP